MSSAVDSTPVSLLVRLRQPEAAEAWTRFVHLFAPLLDRWAHTLGLQDADAADVVQEVFCILVKRLPEFVYDPGRSFRAWLWTILRNASRDRRQRRDFPLLPIESIDRRAAADDIEELTDSEYRHFLVGRAMQIMQADFAPATWRAFWGVVVESRSGVEVARELGVTVNAVYLARARVLSRLRQELAGLDF
jgi:RNA polymerase sigma-70 factor (ECF subfamily)